MPEVTTPMHIMLATDQSVSSHAAAKMVGELCFCERPELTIISAIPMAASDGPKGMPPILQSALEQESEEIQRHLDGLAEKLSASVNVRETCVVVGPPGYEIKLHAETQQIDLIVLGAIGKSMLERVLLGSVSDFVATHVDCNVMVVRVGSGSDEAEMLENVVAPRRVLIALDHSDADQQLVEHVRSYQWAADSQAILTHVIEDVLWFQTGLNDPLPENVVEHLNESRAQVQSYLDSIAQQLHGTFASVASEVIEESHVGEAIITCAAKQKCDMIFTGDHHRGLLDRLLLGSTSRHVLRYANCGVTIVRS